MPADANCDKEFFETETSDELLEKVTEDEQDVNCEERKEANRNLPEAREDSKDD